MSALLFAVSESFSQPFLDEPLSTGTPPAGTESPKPRRRWGLLLLVAAVAMLVGALAATTVVLVVVRGGQHQYAVSVFLTQNVTAEQKTAIESALHALKPVDSIRFETREQAWQRFKELFKDRPDMIAQTSADALPESFQLTTKGREFDCAQLVPIRRLPGVDEIQVIQSPTEGQAGAVVSCG